MNFSFETENNCTNFQEHEGISRQKFCLGKEHFDAHFCFLQDSQKVDFFSRSAFETLIFHAFFHNILCQVFTPNIKKTVFFFYAVSGSIFLKRKILKGQMFLRFWKQTWLSCHQQFVSFSKNFDPSSLLFLFFCGQQQV